MSDTTHEKYLMLCGMVDRLVSAGGKILKTDTWNEGNGCGFESQHEVHFLEISESRVASAAAKGTVKLGDIRAIPYPQGTFDAILDLSTNDHIPDPQKAIAEYRRVIKPRGLLLVITWLCPSPTGPIGSEGPDKQYMFLQPEFENWLAAEKFQILLGIDFPEHTHRHCWLKGYLCRNLM